MYVEKVRNATTVSGAVCYEVTLRIYTNELKDSAAESKLYNIIQKAINGIAQYSEGK